LVIADLWRLLLLRLRFGLSKGQRRESSGACQESKGSGRGQQLTDWHLHAFLLQFFKTGIEAFRTFVWKLVPRATAQRPSRFRKFVRCLPRLPDISLFAWLPAGPSLLVRGEGNHGAFGPVIAGRRT